MSNNPYKEIKQVYDAKVAWGNAKTDEERKTQRDIADDARKKLKGYGYGDIADQVSADGADAAAVKQIMDKWAKMGKNPANDYLYSLGQSKGMSAQDIDKLISLDNQTGELSFGGKKIGTPDSVVDGVSYFADTTVLDNAFNDYINRSGTVRSNQSAVNQENEKLFAKYNQAYEDLKNENPFETEVGKSILAKYDLAGLQGRDNEVASGAGSNGGNIDSFAAANALRQQSALISQGHTAALEAHQQKLDHARALLSDMGVNIDRVFEQEETAKNNDVARKSEIASVTGEVPNEWAVSNNPYMNDDGTIKDEYKDVDFSAVMAKAKAAGNTEAYNAAAVARYYKIMGDYGAYGQYDDGNYIVPGTKKTEGAAEGNREGEYKPTLTAAQALAALKNGEITQGVIDAYNHYYDTSYTVDKPPVFDENGNVVPANGTDSDLTNQMNIIGTLLGKKGVLPDYDVIADDRKLTRSEWEAAKASGSTSDVITYFATYDDYSAYYDEKMS